MDTLQAGTSPNDPQRQRSLRLLREHLHASIAELRGVHRARAVYRDGAESIELARAVSLRAPRAQILTPRVELLYAGVPCIGHIDVAGAIHCDSGREGEPRIAAATPGPRFHEGASSIELQDTPRTARFDDVHIASSVHRDSPEALVLGSPTRGPCRTERSIPGELDDTRVTRVRHVNIVERIDRNAPSTDNPTSGGPARTPLSHQSAHVRELLHHARLPVDDEDVPGWVRRNRGREDELAITPAEAAPHREPHTVRVQLLHTVEALVEHVDVARTVLRYTDGRLELADAGGAAPRRHEPPVRCEFLQPRVARVADVDVSGAIHCDSPRPRRELAIRGSNGAPLRHRPSIRSELQDSDPREHRGSRAPGTDDIHVAHGVQGDPLGREELAVACYIATPLGEEPAGSAELLYP